MQQYMDSIGTATGFPNIYDPLIDGNGSLAFIITMEWATTSVAYVSAYDYTSRLLCNSFLPCHGYK